MMEASKKRERILKVRDLHISFKTDSGKVNAIRGVAVSYTHLTLPTT